MKYRGRLCYGTITKLAHDGILKPRNMLNWYEAQDGIRPSGVKRIRLTCPVCKRRVIASVKTCHDGCCLYYSIPSHKPKHWWKKQKAKWNPK